MLSNSFFNRANVSHLVCCKEYDSTIFEIREVKTSLISRFILFQHSSSTDLSKNLRGRFAGHRPCRILYVMTL